LRLGIVGLLSTHHARPNTKFRIVPHKLNLTTGKSGLILDLVIEAGNPADSDRFLPMLERHISAHGAAPRQAAADGGFASRKNLSRAKACGVRDMAFQGVLSHRATENGGLYYSK
jgi:IS5 family transposase